MEQVQTLLMNIIYAVIGLQLLYTARQVFKDQTNPTRLGATLFWALLGIIFVFGSWIPPQIVGILVVILSILTFFKQVQVGTLPQVSERETKVHAEKLNNKIFIPVVTFALSALAFAQFVPELSRAAVGVGAMIGTIVILIVTKAKMGELVEQSDRMVQQVSSVSILPQLLAALGAVFTIAGVGEVIANIIGSIVPADHQFFGVVAYVLGMVIFTMIMGNGFAAFAVITAGVGIPFVIELGADPIIVGALGLTAGYCGTLMTPMAGNFNALPAALLETKSPYSIIRDQVPVALIMVAVHIVLMYVWAF